MPDFLSAHQEKEVWGGGHEVVTEREGTFVTSFQKTQMHVGPFKNISHSPQPLSECYDTNRKQSCMTICATVFPLLQAVAFSFTVLKRFFLFLLMRQKIMCSSTFSTISMPCYRMGPQCGKLTNKKLFPSK